MTGYPKVGSCSCVSPYRFHDVFHLAHAAKLGWSPVLRGKLLKRKQEDSPDRKRRSDEEVNEVEDGGRAVVTDEAVVAYVWGYAKRHGSWRV